MFYEDYYRDFKKPEMEKGVKTLKSDENKESSEATAENGPETIPEIEKYNQDSETFKANLHDIFKKMTNIKSDEVKIDVEMLRSAKKNNTSLNINVPKTSYGAFLQLYVNEDPSGNKNNIGIVNYITAGYGKMVSRFLHIFDRSVSDELCKFNEEMQNGRMFLENTDATVFNANMHYALMPYEIWMPGGQNTLEEEKQIPVTDISVMYSEADETLKLIHDKSGKEINMFDLGFIIPNNRSNLFRLLDNFTLSKNLYYGVIISSINDIYGYGPAGNKDARVIPRIVFNNNLILQRKSWVISKKNIPFKKSGEQISEYFVRINEWRDLLGISSEVFMVLLSKDKNINNPDPKNSRGVVRDDYKPQFIDFSNPLLVELFEKNIQKLTGDLILKEMLPGPDQLLNVMNKPLVSEFVIQWYEK
ncbi:MAG: hypothetical protein HOP31_08360 [Ignavibacteria bacterium]|nr:hypothetical protein [Ignavibacteria bacterium]